MNKSLSRASDALLRPVRLGPLGEDFHRTCKYRELIENIALVFQDDLKKLIREGQIFDVAIYFCSLIARTFFMIRRRCALSCADSETRFVIVFFFFGMVPALLS